MQKHSTVRFWVPVSARRSVAGRDSSLLIYMRSFLAQRRLRTVTQPAMPMTPPNTATNFIPITGTTPLSAPASAVAVVVPEFLLCVCSCSCSDVSRSGETPPVQGKIKSIRSLNFIGAFFFRQVAVRSKRD
jgi:hypothetical protein